MSTTSVIWINTQTFRQVCVREENLVHTLTHAHARFNVDAQFAQRKQTTSAVMDALLVRKWVKIYVVSGATLVRAATREQAQLALHHAHCTIPMNDVLVQLGAESKIQNISLQGRDAVRDFVNS